jgi:hypothetical protein
VSTQATSVRSNLLRPHARSGCSPVVSEHRQCRLGACSDQSGGPGPGWEPPIPAQELPAITPSGEGVPEIRGPARGNHRIGFGEERRLHTLAGWRDADWFTDAEKSALALTEEVTVLRPGGPPEEVVDCARKHFGDDGLAKLLLAIVTINAWNRVNVTAGVRIGAAPPPVPSPGP